MKHFVLCCCVVLCLSVCFVCCLLTDFVRLPFAFACHLPVLYSLQFSMFPCSPITQLMSLSAVLWHVRAMMQDKNRPLQIRPLGG